MAGKTHIAMIIMRTVIIIVDLKMITILLSIYIYSLMHFLLNIRSMKMTIFFSKRNFIILVYIIKDKNP